MRGYVSLDEIRYLCEGGERFYKLETAERRLREMPNVFPVKNDKGYNVGYRLVREPQQTTLL